MTHTGHDQAHAGTDQAELLDLDAEVLAEHTAAIIDWLPLATSPRQIVDLGCGTGAGALALLTRFPETHVTAVDISVDHLHRLREKACATGVDDQLNTVQADLDGDWPDLGTPDLVWASASMHHLADPDRTLRRVHDLLTPGGLFVVVELAGFPRFLPEDAPGDRPGLEERCHAVTAHHHAEHLPHRGADWGPKLTAAGFTLEAERTITVHLDHSPTVGRYATSSLSRMRHAVGDALEPADRTALDRLLDPGNPDGLLHRTDLVVRTERTVWAARR